MRFERRISVGVALVAAACGVARAAPPADYGRLDGVRTGQLLRSGSAGPAVTALQHALTAAGKPVLATGVFDAATDAAVRSFQAAKGCAVDGIVGRETMRALDAALGAAPGAPTTGSTAGLRPLKNAEVTPAITAAAVAILRDHRNDPIGTKVPFDADGKHYVGRIELHYHTPGGPLRPWGYHPGVTVYEVVGAPPAPPAPPPAPPAPPSPPSSGPRTTLSALPRVAGARTGSEYLTATASSSRAARDQATVDELARGNVPSFLRSFVDVTVSQGGHTLVFKVLPDYVSIGSDQDFVRMPMGAAAAQRVADLFGCSLPTRRMVDLIWHAATVRVAPSPMTPGAAMMSNAYFQEHQRRVEAQLAGKPRGELTAGHKKDLVITNLLARHPGRVAIYGWHLSNGKAIQPLSTVHEAGYADYSHGVRLIDRTVVLDGRPVSIESVLRDPSLAPLLSDEGPIASPRIP